MSKSKWFNFKPTKELYIVLLSWIIIVSVIYAAFQLFTTQMVAANFITFGVVGIVFCGIIFPTIWNTLIMKRPISSIGITKNKFMISVILSIIFTIIQYMITLKDANLPAFKELLPLIIMSLAVGFYENLFYRGWLQLRIEKFFGIIPSIVISGVLYSLYHIGYGMHTNEMLTLFIVGIIYGVIFRITCNIFILFPLLTPTGALFTITNDGLRIPFEATYGFTEVLIIIIVTLIIINRKSRKQSFSILPNVKKYFS